jgi:hypothetical protein
LPEARARDRRLTRWSWWRRCTPRGAGWRGAGGGAPPGARQGGHRLAALDADPDTGLATEWPLAGLFATRDREIGMASFVEQGPGKATFEGR